MQLPGFFERDRRVYLDHAAATPIAPAVCREIEAHLSRTYGNASAVHAEGRAARNAIEDARTSVARTLTVREHEVVFTASGTESNNLAIRGLVRFLTEKQGRCMDEIEIISTKIEHPSILAVLASLAARGVQVRYAPLHDDGRINVKKLSDMLSPRTALVTCAYANSEIGVVEDVKRITRTVRKYNTDTGADVRVHVDAAQAPLWLPCQNDMLGVDLMSLDAGKFAGPKGVGILTRKRSVELSGIILGGEQEGGLRAGTENTALIVGAAAALVRAQEEYDKRSARVASVRDYFLKTLEAHIEGVVLNGSREHRIANNINISIPGIDGEYAVVTLDAHGIAASTRSACGSIHPSDAAPAADLTEPGSHVVRTLTGSGERASSTIRFTLGEETTKRDARHVVEVLADHVSLMNSVQ